MAKNKTIPYRYTACGLDNVFIHGMAPVVDDEGHEVYGVKKVSSLHRAIAREIVACGAAMTVKELRFLRTEMGFTQAELGKVIHKEALTIGRWERGEKPIDPNAETLIRLIAIEKLNLTSDVSTEELASFSVATADPKIIDIDGSDPENYRPIAA